jgi:hypothetical protein
MPATEAQINANRQNAAHSTGPKTEEGKERSRRNSLKHGMTGDGIVLLEADEAEVQRRTACYANELMAIGEVGQAVVRRAALNSVRMERGADQQKAALTRRLREVEEEFIAPEDVDTEEAATLRAEAIRIAMFDPTKEATLARQYEASAERGFYKALKQLRQMELQAEALLKADEAANHAANVNAMMGSIFEAQRAARKMDDEFDALYPELSMSTPGLPSNSAQFAENPRIVDVPITIGRPR